MPEVKHYRFTFMVSSVTIVIELDMKITTDRCKLITKYEKLLVLNS